MLSFKGRFAWRELSTTDVPAAKRFYGTLFGWNFEDQPMETIGAYTVCNPGERPVAGMMPCVGGMVPMWVGYAFVDDVDAATARAGRVGGKRLAEPADVPGIGRMSWISDPAGAFICPFKDAMPPPADADLADFEPRENEFGWAELCMPDIDAAERFYAETFGWRFRRVPAAGGEPAYLSVLASPRPRASIGPPVGKPAQWRHYLQVESVETTARRIVDSGGTIREAPRAFPGGTLAIAADPQGAVFGLWGP